MLLCSVALQCKKPKQFNFLRLLHLLRVRASWICYFCRNVRARVKCSLVHVSWRSIYTPKLILGIKFAPFQVQKRLWMKILKLWGKIAVWNIMTDDKHRWFKDTISKRKEFMTSDTHNTSSTRCVDIIICCR